MSGVHVHLYNDDDDGVCAVKIAVLGGHFVMRFVLHDVVVNNATMTAL